MTNRVLPYAHQFVGAMKVTRKGIICQYYITKEFTLSRNSMIPHTPKLLCVTLFLYLHY